MEVGTIKTIYNRFEILVPAGTISEKCSNGITFKRQNIPFQTDSFKSCPWEHKNISVQRCQTNPKGLFGIVAPGHSH